MNKFNKGKLIGIVAASLSAVSLMGVGFASWIVTGAEGSAADGNITVSVADVQDQRVTITDAKVADDNNTINFDANGDGGLLKPSGTAAEDLTFGIEFKLNLRANAKDVFSGIKAYVTGAELLSAVNSNFVALPTGVYENETTMKATESTALVYSVDELPTSGTNVTTNTDGSTTYTITKTLTMGWGSAFNNDNPAKLTDKTKLDDYVRDLKALKALNTKTFTLYLMPFTTGA